MDGTVDGFRYGAVTPVAAYLMACLGGALGLRCIVRSLLNAPSWKTGWLALGAAAIGCGIWTMHFIAMIGFHVEETRVRYDAATTVLSLVVAWLNATDSEGHTLPIIGIFVTSRLRVRSGLTTVQLSPYGTALLRSSC